MCGRSAHNDNRSGASDMNTQTQQCWTYRLRIEEELDETAATWFDDTCLAYEGGQTIIEVTIIDQSHLQGLLKRIHDLHLHVVSLDRRDSPST